MIKVTVTYPSGEGSTFHHDYYAGSHVPLAVKAWSPLRTEIDKYARVIRLARIPKQ